MSTLEWQSSEDKAIDEAIARELHELTAEYTATVPDFDQFGMVTISGRTFAKLMWSFEEGRRLRKRLAALERDVARLSR